jgi:hypothetical protein
MSMRDRLEAVAVLAAVLLLAVGCANPHGGPLPKIPMPSNVPTTPTYPTVADVQTKLGQAGLPCQKTLGINATYESGATLTCVAELDGEKFDNEINVFAATYSRALIGDEIGHKRQGFNGIAAKTIVAAGNWYVWVKEPRFAPRIAAILGGVVLPAQGPKTPDPPLPTIPAAPRYDTVGQLATALDAAVGCDHQRTDADDVLTCDTGRRVGHGANCATLALYATPRLRDQALRTAISYQGVPAVLVAAGNWTVNLCDYDLGRPVATALHGALVSHDGG